MRMRQLPINVKRVNIRPLIRLGIFSVGAVSVFLLMCFQLCAGVVHESLSDIFVSVSKDLKPSVVNIEIKRVLTPDLPLPEKRRNIPHNNPFLNKLPRGKIGDGSEVVLQSTGVIIDKRGYIITNEHLIREIIEIIVTLHDGSEFKAELVGEDKRIDIAVLKIDAKGLVPVETGDSDSLELGEIVLTMGFPKYWGLLVSSGVISAKGMFDARAAGFVGFYQTDAAINAINSGGPLVDLQGKVVGINTTMLTQAGSFPGVGNVVPINVAMSAVRDLIEYGKVVEGWLGITAQNVTTQFQELLRLENKQGALISNVEPNSPAKEAGLQSGDVVIAYGGREVKSVIDFMALVTGTEINEEVGMAVIRDGKRLKLKTRIIQRSKGGIEEDMSRKLGFTVQQLTKDMARNIGFEVEKGLIITNIQADSPAHEAGLNIGDLILEVQHKPVERVEDVQQVLISNMDKDEVLMFVKRRNGVPNYVVLKIR